MVLVAGVGDAVGEAVGDVVAVGVGLGEGVVVGDGVAATVSVVQSATAAIVPQIPATRISMTSSETRYLRRAVAIRSSTSARHDGEPGVSCSSS
jgi:hypothetical protein